MRIESGSSVVSSPLPHPCPDTRRKLSRHLQIGGEAGSENKPDAHCICQTWCGSYFDVVKILGEMDRFRVPRLLFKMMHKQLCSQMILCCTGVSCSFYLLRHSDLCLLLSTTHSPQLQNIYIRASVPLLQD